MIAVAQVVKKAIVQIKDQDNTKIETKNGFIVFLGVSKSDTYNDVEKVVNKLIKLRVFPDEKDKMNLNIESVNGEILLISQFTLLADLKGNNRPDFNNAASKPLAIELYQLFADKLNKAGIITKTGFFGESMQIDPMLEGPITIILDSNSL